MDSFLQDVRYGVRRMSRERVANSAALLTIAIGIAANVAAFSVVNTVLIQPLPFPHADRLMVVSPGVMPMADRSMSPRPDVFDWASDSSLFSAVALYAIGGASVGGDQAPERVSVAVVMPSFFQTLQVSPSIGRTFPTGERQRGPDEAVILSDRLWRERFASDQRIIGSSVQLNGHERVVVGIMRPGFAFPAHVDAWVPLTLPLTRSTMDLFGPSVSATLIARLRPNITVGQAQARVNDLVQQLNPRRTRASAEPGTTIVPLQTYLFGKNRRLLLGLMGAACLALLIALTNVGSLLLSRAAQREREIGARIAFGATNQRILRQLLAEGALFAFSGVVVGLVLSLAALKVIARVMPLGIISLRPIRPDAMVIAYAIALAVVVSLAFAFAPALHLRGLRISGTVLTGDRGTITSAMRFRLQAAVVAELALALILTVCAGLLVQTIRKLADVNIGFRSDHVLTAQFSLPVSVYPDRSRWLGFTSELLDKLRTEPDIVESAVINMAPLTLSDLPEFAFEVVGSPPPRRSDMPFAVTTSVSPDYFRVMSIHLLAGRGFSTSDQGQAQDVAIVNRTLAQRYFGHGNPIGKEIRFSDDSLPRRIVGIASDVRGARIDEDPEPQIYVPVAQAPMRFGTIVVLTRGQPGLASAAVRDAVQSVDKNMAPYNVAAMDDVRSASIARQRVAVVLLGVLGCVSLLLALVGVYAVVSYMVSQSARSFGIRAALGASPAGLMTAVLGESAKLILLATVIGLAGASAVSRLLSGLLFGVQPIDLRVFLIAAALVALAAILATLRPAVRAARTDPMLALRWS